MTAADRTHLIESIRALNPTAPAAWLAEFDLAELRNYLRRLELACERGPRTAGWVRPEGASPVAYRRPAA